MGKKSYHTQAAEMAAGDMKRVIERMTDAPFMDTAKSDRTAKRDAVIATSSPEVQGLLGQGFSKELVACIARMENE